MWTYYLQTMLELNENIKSLPILKRSVLGCAFKAAYDAKKISESHCIQYIAIMYATGVTDDVILNIIDGSLAMYPTSAPIWESKMKFCIQCKDDQRVEKVFKEAKRKLGNESHSIYGLYMKYLFALENGKSALKALFKEIVGQPHENFRSLKVDCIENTAALFGVSEARKFFNYATTNGFLCLEMFNKLAEIEELQVRKTDDLQFYKTKTSHQKDRRQCLNLSLQILKDFFFGSFKTTQNSVFAISIRQPRHYFSDEHIN